MKVSELQSLLGILRRNAAGCEVVNSATGLKVRKVPALREQEMKALGAFRSVSVEGSTALIKIAPEKALVHALRGKPATAVATMPNVKALTAELKEAKAALEASQVRERAVEESASAIHARIAELEAAVEQNEALLEAKDNMLAELHAHVNGTVGCPAGATGALGPTGPDGSSAGSDKSTHVSDSVGPVHTRPESGTPPVFGSDE